MWNKKPTEDQIVGSFVGCAIGDALGMPVEGWPRERIKKHFGRITEMMDPVILKDEEGKLLSEDEFGKLHNWTRDFQKGDYTDDTILSLAIAQSIISRGLPDIHDIGYRHARVYQKYKSGFYKGGFGGTTKKAMRALLAGVSPLKSGVPESLGTGPAMKMAPLGLWAAAQGIENSTMEYFARKIGEMTHLEPAAVQGGILHAAATKAAMNNSFANHFICTMQYFCGNIREYEEKLDWIRYNHANIFTCESSFYERLGSSFKVTDAYPLTLWYVVRYWDDPIKGLEELVSQGGDCDTTGAMYGAIVGARHGMIWPERWTKDLQGFDRIVKIAKSFYQTISG